MKKIIIVMLVLSACLIGCGTFQYEKINGLPETCSIMMNYAKFLSKTEKAESAILGSMWDACKADLKRQQEREK